MVAVSLGGEHFLNNWHDIDVYLERGAWWPTGGTPYEDVFSEYPELATWFLALPYVLLRAFSLVTGLPVETATGYTYVFTVLMGVLLAATTTLIHAMRTDRRWLAYLLLLPSTWYFAHNRYDILPAFLVVLSLYLLQRGRAHPVGLLLGAATMTKWYPVVILPVVLVYLWQRDRTAARAALGGFLGVVVLVAAVTLLSAGVSGFLVPYEFHAGRWGNSQSLLILFDGWGVLDAFHGPARAVFRVLQFLPAIVVLFLRVTTWRAVVAWSLLSVLAFMLGNSVYSPQWLLWVAPLLLLIATSRLDVLLVLTFNCSTILMFPVAFHRTGSDGGWFVAAVACNLAVVLIWLVRSAWLVRDEQVSRPVGSQP